MRHRTGRNPLCITTCKPEQLSASHCHRNREGENMRHTRALSLILNQSCDINKPCPLQANLVPLLAVCGSPTLFDSQSNSSTPTLTSQPISTYRSAATSSCVSQKRTHSQSPRTLLPSSNRPTSLGHKRSCRWQGSKAKAPSRKRGPAEEYRPQKVWRLEGRLPKRIQCDENHEADSKLTSIGRSVPRFLQSACKHFSTRVSTSGRGE